jgi:uncharacterized repeat protein (TIGR01451 family)
MGSLSRGKPRRVLHAAPGATVFAERVARRVIPIVLMASLTCARAAAQSAPANCGPGNRKLYNAWRDAGQDHSAAKTFSKTYTIPGSSSVKTATVFSYSTGGGSVYQCALSSFIGPSQGHSGSETPSLPTSGVAATGAAITDLNGDGIPDLAGIVQQTNQAVVYLSNSNLSLRNGVFYNVGTNPSSIDVSDVNGDGFPDLIVTNQDSDNVSILLGNGDGTFRSAANYGSGGSPVSVAAADFNGDGKPDLAVANDVSLSLMLGNGDGSFQSPVSLITPGGLSVVAADFNGDGKPDLALGQYNSSTGAAPLVILLGNGNGTFQTPLTSAPGPGNPDYLAFADFNQDGNPDVAISHGLTNSLSVLLGKGNGTFQPPVTYIAGAAPYDFSMLDVNGDGILDFAVGDLDSELTIQFLFGNGDGTFQAPPYYPVPGASPTNVPATNSIAVADFNQDGNPDVAVTSLPENYVTVFLGQGGDLFSAGTNIPVEQTSGLPTGPAFLVASDFNGDGKPDLAVADQQADSVSILLGDGKGSFQPPAFYPAGSNPQYLIAADFNGDGKPDLAVANSAALSADQENGSISILLGQSSGAFQAPVNYAAGAHPYAMVAADLNGDGILDLAVADNGALGTSNYGGVWILPGNRNGTFGAATLLAAGENPVHLAAADLNGDGDLDLIVATTSSPGTGEIVVLMGNGKGAFQAQASLTTFNPPVWISITDVNGDGIPDIIAAEQGDLGYFQGNGDGTFQAEIPFPGGASPSGIAVAAFGNFSLPSLAVADEGGGMTVMLSQVATSVPPVLGILSTHTGDFTQGETGAEYTVTVGNAAGVEATNGPVTVTETLPTGITLVSMAGTGWTCAAATCTRSDSLASGASYPPITVTVNVAATASSPQVNTASVSGGGSGSVTATDSTTVGPALPAAFFAGQVSLGSGAYYLQFANSNVFGYYNFPTNAIFYHYDMGFEAFIAGSAADIYLYDFTSGHWWYTSSTLFPYLYDFTLQTWIYYFPNTTSPGHYTTNPRYFSNLTTGKIFPM